MDPTEMEQADDEFSVERVLDKRVSFFQAWKVIVGLGSVIMRTNHKLISGGKGR